MYEYLLNHNYISYNKKPCKDGLYKQKELSVQRARCIANKCDALTIELQEQLSQLQQEKEEIIKWLEKRIKKLNSEYTVERYARLELMDILSKLKESDNT